MESSGLASSGLPSPAPLDPPTGPLAFPITTLWIAGVVNFVNFMDGIDGLASVHALITSVILALAFAHERDGSLRDRAVAHHLLS